VAGAERVVAIGQLGRLVLRLALLVLFDVAACGPSAPRCHFGVEHPVFASSAAGYDDVALVWVGTHAALFFSEQSGLYARWLDARGLPGAPAERLGPRCDAGVAAAVSGNALQLACARRATDQPASDGDVSLYALDQRLRVQHVSRFGEVGRSSRGVAIAASSAGLTLVWQDATLDAARVWLMRGFGAQPIAISDPGFAASAPALAADSAHVYVTWSETRENGRSSESRVQLAELAPGLTIGPKAVTVAHSRDASPSPALAASEHGLWLAFRDRRRASRRTGLYLARLDRAGRALGAPVRAARADGVGRPALRRCLGGVFAATPRTFAGDYFVGVVRGDPTLRTLSGEQQFYEDSHEFAQVGATCAGDHALLLMAERARPGRGGAALRSVSFSCD
jgi:hypothetical protein